MDDRVGDAIVTKREGIEGGDCPAKARHYGATERATRADCETWSSSCECLYASCI